ncbi:MAG: nucleotide exchange factor GrpE [Lachnospiraceae bacterium]|nr:nucleotide exchange factor GrpE [Lachnospiraceae bacterium]
MSKKKHNKVTENIEQEHAKTETQDTTETVDSSATEEKDAVQEEANPIELLEAQVAELKDKYLRQVAEFDNYRKRTLKEKTELILNGGEKVMTALLPVMDDFERALESFNKSSDVDALREGVTLIFEKLVKTLESQGLKAIEAVGQDFNTDFHEAIAMIPATNDDEKGKVIDCVQTGYMLNEKVIRHAKVAIGQ